MKFRDVLGKSDGEIFSDQPPAFSYRDWELLRINLVSNYLPEEGLKQAPSWSQAQVTGQVEDGESSGGKDKGGEGECEDTEHVS